MSALAEAIRRGRHRTDLGATSPFAGLRRRHAGTIDVVAQSVAATAPAGVLLIHPSALSSRSGSFAFFDVVVTVSLVVMIALVLGMFARRISSTGSLYTFVARGLGPHVALIAGSALALGSLAVAMSTLGSGASRVAELIAGDDPPGWLVAIIVAAAGGLIAVLIAQGLRLSTRVLFVVEAIAVVTVVALSITALLVSKVDFARLIPDPTAVSPEAVMAGVAFSLVGFVGFESGTALAPETRRPFARVPRAILLSVGATSLALLVGTAAQLSLVTDTDDSALATATGSSALIDAIVAVSFLACAFAMTNAATRVAFAMSREGLLPAVFGRTSRRGVPALGGMLLAAGVVVLPLASIALTGSRQALRMFTSPASVLGFVIAYALVCLAAPVFLARIGELSAGAAVLAFTPFLGLVAVLGFYLVRELGEKPLGVIVCLAVLAALTLAGTIRMARRPGLADRVGMHDWAVDTDTIEGLDRA